jgi:glycosyltransferase involved in cell wall biosynthesis
MHILFLTQILPYPPDAGPRVKTWNVIRYLVGLGYQVTLATFVRPEEQKYIGVLEKLCYQVYSICIKRSRVGDVGHFVRSLITGRPFLIVRDDLQEMSLVVEKILGEQNIDVIHADQLTMAQFALSKQDHKPLGAMEYGYEKDQRQKPFLIFDAHNAVWTVLERMSENVPWYLKPLAAFEARKIKHYEGEVVNAFDHTFAVTEIDRLSLLSAATTGYQKNIADGELVSVVPIAIDTSEIQPVQLIDDTSNILTLGTLHYPPNADGIRWFIEQVFPRVRERVPEAYLTIIGKNPPQDFIRFANENADYVSVTGYVPDLNPYLEKAAVLVIPVRAGGGMRVRILEGLAYGEAIVTTTVGLEGIDVVPGREVLVADTPQDFAEAVIRLLENFELRKEIGANGRERVERSYDWQVVLRSIKELYQQIELTRQRVPSPHE